MPRSSAQLLCASGRRRPLPYPQKGTDVSEQLNIRDDVLESAATFLALAAGVMVEGNRTIPRADLESMTGIGGEVRRFLTGLQTGRLALADAAKTAAGEVAGVMRDSSALDARMANALYAGFAVEGSRR